MIHVGMRSDQAGMVVINGRNGTLRVGIDEWLEFANAVKRGDFDGVTEQPVETRTVVLPNDMPSAEYPTPDEIRDGDHSACIPMDPPYVARKAKS